MKQYRNYLIDFDGTLMDSGKSVMESVQYALDHFDLKNQPIEELRKFVGPSLMDSFQHIYQMSESDAKKAVGFYREIYGSKMFDVTIYPGVQETLQANLDRGCRNVLVTSKPIALSTKILNKIGLEKYFCYRTGPDLTDPSSDKARLVKQALYDLQLDPADCLMVGDTRFDMEGAKAMGVDACGVTYGYGTVEELQKAGADFLIDDMRKLLE